MVEFPDVSYANEEGLLAIGGDLEPQTLLAAYEQGIFPWFADNQPIMWWSPDPRMVLFPADFHCSKRLARRMRKNIYRVSFDEDFAAVIHASAEVPRQAREGTWILPEMIKAYSQLHQLGHAHSVEVWDDDVLVGGLYGVLHRHVFFAESMFSRSIDASKVALAALCARALQQQWTLIDCQFHTGHLQSLGAREISRFDFMTLIHKDI